MHFSFAECLELTPHDRGIQSARNHLPNGGWFSYAELYAFYVRQFFCGEARCAGAVSVSAFDAFLNKGIRRRKQLIGFLLGLRMRFCGSTDVKLQLGFCSARADNNGGVSAFAESKTKNIALRQLSGKKKD